MDAQPDESESAPMFSIVRGEPTDEELAALVVVLASRSGGGEPAGPSKVSGWTDHARNVHGRLTHSPDGWRASALPR